MRARRRQPLTGETAGWHFELRKHPDLDADHRVWLGRQYHWRRCTASRSQWIQRRQESMHARTSHTRKSGGLGSHPFGQSSWIGIVREDRWVKAKCRTTCVYDTEESDGSIVPTKQSNKGRKNLAETVEGRVKAKRSASGLIAYWTLSQNQASSNLECTRKEVIWDTQADLRTLCSWTKVTVCPESTLTSDLM